MTPVHEYEPQTRASAGADRIIAHGEMAQPDAGHGGILTEGQDRCQDAGVISASLRLAWS